MNELEYKAAGFRIPLSERIKDFFVGFFDRKKYFKSFCAKNGIELPITKGKHYHLPVSYLVEHDVLNDNFDVCEKAILERYSNKYIVKQQKIDKQLIDVKTKIEDEKRVLKQEENQLQALIKKMNASKDSQLRLWCQSKMGTMKAKINNIKTTISELDSEKEKLEAQKKQNIANWKKQVEIIENEIYNQNRRFVLNLTKKITRKLGFTDYKYNVKTHSDNIKKILNGDYE